MKITKLFIIVILLFLTRCDLLTNPPGSNSPLEKTVTKDKIEYKLTIPKNEFGLQDSLKITFKVTNKSLIPREFDFSNIQQFGFRLTNKFNRTVLYYPTIVSPALSSFNLYPGKSKTYSGSYILKDLNGQYISKEDYFLHAYLLDQNLPEVMLPVKVM